MKLLRDYTTLSDCLHEIKNQAIESISYAEKFIPASVQSAEELFYYLKDRITYVSDPPGIELIMTMKTMMSGERTGIRGGGDCDDFTITSLACLHVMGFTQRVALAGNNKGGPGHIYVKGKGDSGKWFTFDLTEPEFNRERKYKYYQYLPIIL